MAYYIENKETGKIELHFEKSEYEILSYEQKKTIKSNFLFSRHAGAWVSRCKFPNLYMPKHVAESLGLENAGKTGERLTFEEQQERKAERAERRADRMEYKAERAAERGEALQKPINDMHGDIAFFTQPNINTSGGRAFTRRRNRMFEAWERGFEEFRKSEYYSDCAEKARRTAQDTKPKDKGFCQRRIEEAEKTIRAQKKNLEHYQELLKKIEAGEVIRKVYYGSDEAYTAADIEEWIDKAEEIIEGAIEKSIYYHEIIESLGGVVFSKENIKPGYIVQINNHFSEVVTVVSAGNKNIKYKTASGFVLIASYAEIGKVIKAVEAEKKVHPYKVGDTFQGDRWNSDARRFEKVTYTVIKVTDKTATLQAGDEKPFNRKPGRREFMSDGNDWYLAIDDHQTWYKRAEAV